MKDIVLITNYWHFECEKASSRYYTLAKMLVEQNVELEVITSDFYHATKSYREYNKEFLESHPYKISLIHEGGYSKNISIRRIISHKEFAKNVMRYLKKRKKPDVIYCVVPSLDVAYLVTQYANKNGIRVIVDIQDLWPEAYRMAIDIPVVSDILFFPMQYKANKIYAAADQIVAVSDTYVKRGLAVNKKCHQGVSAYLGIELEKFDELVKLSKDVAKPKNEIWVAYIGTLGHSYVIPTIIEALKVVKIKKDICVKFVVMGNGPLKEEFKRVAEESGIYFEFTGTLPYAEMVGVLAQCDIAVNPIKSNSAASIINKVGDYAAAGLPVINTQESEEYIGILKKYEAGFNCKNNNIQDIAEKIILLCRDKELRENMGMNSRKLAEEKFDRKTSYLPLVEVICKNEERK